MVTTSSVTYSVDFSSDENIKSAKVTLKDSENNIINNHTFINGEDEEFTFSGLTKKHFIQSNSRWSTIQKYQLL